MWTENIYRPPTDGVSPSPSFNSVVVTLYELESRTYKLEVTDRNRSRPLSYSIPTRKSALFAKEKTSRSALK